MRKRSCKLRKLLAALCFLSVAVTACGTEAHVLRTGPTITPAPETASDGESEPQRNVPGEEEGKALCTAAVGRMTAEYPWEQEVTIGEEYKSELVKYDDGASDVIATDSDGNEVYRLMYDSAHKLERQIINCYEDGKVVSGAQYAGTELASYFETEEKNGICYVDITVEGEELIAKLTDENGGVFACTFDKNGKIMQEM